MTHYIIGEPIANLPSVFRRVDENDWSLAYIAARKANGHWVPVDCEDRVEARKLRDVSKKQPEIEAVMRGQVVYLRVRSAVPA